MDVAEFDQFADEYENLHAANIAISGERPDFFSEYKIRVLRDDTIRSALHAGSILDFGSGIGNSVPFFRSYFPDASLTCCDVSQRSLNLAHARFPNKVTQLLLDDARIDLPSGTFDIAFSACVFHHIPHDEHDRWLRELRRVVRPDGMIVIFEHNPLNPLTMHAVNTCPFDANAHLIRHSALKHGLSSVGCRKVDTRFHIFFPRLLSRLRPLEPMLSWLPIGAQYSVLARN
jgi:SAM-dependent methyltransferase